MVVIVNNMVVIVHYSALTIVGTTQTIHSTIHYRRNYNGTPTITIDYNYSGNYTLNYNYHAPTSTALPTRGIRNGRSQQP